MVSPASSARSEADSLAPLRLTGCPCGCLTKLPWFDDLDCVRHRRYRRSANPARELEAWASAVKHLHEAGLPAAVPSFAAAWLRRRGVRPDWTAAA